MKNYYLIHYVLPLLILLVVFSCGSKPDDKVKIPGNVLSEEKFAKLLVDFALAESAANLNIKNTPVKRLDTVYAFNPLKENHVSKAVYDATLVFYANHAELYQKVYEDVLASLSEMQIKRDSLKKTPVSK